MHAPVLADQQAITANCTDIGCNLEDIPEQSQGTPYYQHDLTTMMMMTIAMTLSFADSKMSVISS